MNMTNSHKSIREDYSHNVHKPSVLLFFHQTPNSNIVGLRYELLMSRFGGLDFENVSDGG